MKTKMLIIATLLAFNIGFSQKKITWTDLSHIKFTEKFFPAYDTSFFVPTFLPPVKALDGKQITITGYFLNIDPKGELYILSKGPMSACFFCGIGGPETAIELQFTSKQLFKTDNIVSVTGILKLNATDVDHFTYILTECKGQRIN
ncbi:hypothetical protein [Confluentibacter sediminis]|uniref:hypothetical protein n=1 Tax=Confluentibacter sediminis TaxID=2219045 RepID=UPI000DAE7FBE|nr:hypothetical protein [Confluentibacter sediminis]